jgi:hypothetical protein
MDKEQSAELAVLESEFEIADLEYDVGGLGAGEATDAQVNYAANMVVMVMPRSQLPSR